jgi:hypothetical protein
VIGAVETFPEGGVFATPIPHPIAMHSSESSATNPAHRTAEPDIKRRT